MKELPNFDTIEELAQWLSEELACSKNTSEQDERISLPNICIAEYKRYTGKKTSQKKDWIPVERKSHIDYFDLPLTDKDTEVNTEI